MATVEVKTCDVSGKPGTAKNPVNTYLVEVVRPEPGGEGDQIFSETLDLSKSSLDRLLKFVERGTKKPS